MEAIDVDKAVEFILSCMNFDGGFGSRPGSESHAGLIYCCLGTLSITGTEQSTCNSIIVIDACFVFHYAFLASEFFFYAGADQHQPT